MRLLSHAATILVLLAVPIRAADPTPSIDDKLAQLIAAKAQLEKDKAIVAQLEADIRKQMVDLLAKLAAQGITLEPPAPPDALALAVQKAYADDPSVGKNRDAAILAATYREVVKQLAVMESTDTLAVAIRSSAEQISNRLATIRPLFGADFATVIPGKTAPLTAELKAEAKKRLEHYATILEGLK